MEHQVAFRLAPLNEPNVPLYTINRPSHGEGHYSLWADSTSSIELQVEPIDGDTQFLVEWKVDTAAIPADRILRVVQGIRNTAEQLKLDCRQPLSNLKVTVLGGSQSTSDNGFPVQMAASLAFQDALAKVKLVALEEL